MGGLPQLYKIKQRPQIEGERRVGQRALPHPANFCLELNAAKDLRSFQWELNNDAPHDIVEFVVLPWTERVFIVTGYAGFRDRSIRIDRFEVGTFCSSDRTRMYCTRIIRHRL